MITRVWKWLCRQWIGDEPDDQPLSMLDILDRTWQR